MKIECLSKLAFILMLLRYTNSRRLRFFDMASALISGSFFEGWLGLNETAILHFFYMPFDF